MSPFASSAASSAPEPNNILTLRSGAPTRSAMWRTLLQSEWLPSRSSSCPVTSPHSLRMDALTSAPARTSSATTLTARTLSPSATPVPSPIPRHSRGSNATWRGVAATLPRQLTSRPGCGSNKRNASRFRDAAAMWRGENPALSRSSLMSWPPTRRSSNALLPPARIAEIKRGSVPGGRCLSICTPRAKRAAAAGSCAMMTAKRRPSEPTKSAAPPCWQSVARRGGVSERWARLLKMARRRGVASHSPCFC
mmetsp:Transcript_56958/g.123813  ORF Transcript_56958/g.123813 Transcript_56958/m.123813 type:complete len:251 (-) Transcript_56958:234-986(-)